MLKIPRERVKVTIANIPMKGGLLLANTLITMVKQLWLPNPVKREIIITFLRYPQAFNGGDQDLGTTSTVEEACF
jgi:hypothetical protein